MEHGAATDATEPACAFCGRHEDVSVTQRLGVDVAVCARCTARFSAATATAPAPSPAPVERGPLPPTLGQQTSAVLQHVTRMAKIVASRPFSEDECPRCSAVVHTYPGPDGDPVGLAKDSVLATSIPLEDSWRVQDGTAVPATEDDELVGARFLHVLVCGDGPEPANARLRQVWRATLAETGTAP